MKKLIRPTNKDETYCCSMKDVKALFNDTEITVSFAYGCREFSGSRMPNVKNKIKGSIVYELTTRTRLANTHIYFFIIKACDYSEKLRQKFVIECLPKLYDFYIKMLNDQSVLIQHIIMLVELFDGKFIMHKIINDLV